MPVPQPYIPSRKFLAVGVDPAEKINLSDYLTDLEVVRSVEPQTIRTFDGSNFEQLVAGVETWQINATWVASNNARGVRRVLGGLVGTLAYFEASPGSDKPTESQPIIRGRCFIDSLPGVPAGGKREVGTFSTSWTTSGQIQVATPRLWWRRWHGITREPTGIGSLLVLANQQPPNARGSGTSLDLVPELGLEGPPRHLTLRLVQAVAKQRFTTVRWRAGNDGVDERIYAGILAADTSPPYGPNLTGQLTGPVTHDPVEGVELHPIRWRRFEGLGAGGRPTSLANALGEANNLASNIGGGNSGNSDDDVGIDNIDYTLTLRAIQCTVKAGQEVRLVSYRSSGAGVNAAMWCGIVPATNTARGPIPDITATPIAEASRTTPITSRWTSSPQSVPAGTLPAGTTFYVVSAHWQETATPHGRLQVNFDNAGWVSDFTSTADPRVGFAPWHWYDYGAGWESADQSIAYNPGDRFYLAIGHYRGQHPSRGRVHVSFDGGTTWVTDLLADYPQVEFPNWAWT